MIGGFCYGRACQLGWGYNQSLDLFIPIEEKLPNSVHTIDDEWEFYNESSAPKTNKRWSSCVYSLSSTIIPYWASLVSICRTQKILDFQIIFDENEYWQVHYCVYKRREEYGGFQNYPLNCSHFVQSIEYGVDLWVQFPKKDFPKGNWKVDTLFDMENWTGTQKKANCRVLINCRETREVTLEELIVFMKELDKGKHFHYDIPIFFKCEMLDQEIQKTVIHNEFQFGIFLSYLYSIYRKIEIKMNQINFPSILPDLDSSEESLDNIRINLNKAKEEYKVMDKNDILKMYPILKNLFFRYMDYITYSINNMNDIDEGRSLPGTFQEIQPCLTLGNRWSAIQFNSIWFNCIGPQIQIPPKDEQKKNTSFKEKKVKGSQGVKDNKETKPNVKDKNKKKSSPASVFVKEDKKAELPNISTVSESKPSTECPRKTLYMKCKAFLKIKRKPEEQSSSHPHLLEKCEYDQYSCNDLKPQNINEDIPLPSVCQATQQTKIQSNSVTDN